MNVKARACLAILGLFGCRGAANAMFMVMDEDVPTEKIVAQVEKIIKDNPKDAHAHYVLGRVHSLAWAQGGDQVRLTPRKDALPEFGPTNPIRVRPQPAAGRDGRSEPSTQPSEAAMKHLQASIDSYRKAVELDPKNGLYHLGLAWMLEQKLAQKPKPANTDKDTTGAEAKEILAMYVKAFDLTLEKDLKSQDNVMAADTFVSAEAADDALRIMEAYPADTKDDALKKRLQDGRDQVMARPMGITPVIVSTRPGATLSSLVDENADVAFDLAGMGTGHRWPWVQPTTGILVWDPKHDGAIASGRQLFGTMTWQMLFRDGYEALSMLDENHDGSLSTTELAPVGIWFDTNANGVSDAGEVKTASEAGITSIAVKATRDGSGTLAVQKGVTWRDGRQTPSYDWVPVSKPLNR